MTDFFAIHGNDRPGARMTSIGFSGVAVKGRSALQCRERLEEDITQRGLSQPPLKRGVHLRRRFVKTQERLIFQSAQEFQLAKLFRLKSACRTKPVAKGEKMCRQHRFQDRE